MSLFKPDIQKMEGKRDIKGLIKAAKNNSDPSIRYNAVQALGRLKEPDAVEELIGLLKDEDYLVVSYASQSLGKIGDLRAVSPLVAILDIKSQLRSSMPGASDLGKYRIDIRADDIVKSAIGALGSIGSAEAVKGILRAYFTSDSNPVADKAREVLAAPIFRDICIEASKAVIAGKGDAPKIRALELLEKMAGDGIVPLLEMALKDRSTEVQEKAASVLYGIKDPASVPCLIDALGSRNSYVLYMAAETLGAIKDPHASIPLASLLGNSDDSVACSAADALEAIGKSAVDALVGVLSGKGNITAREKSIELLGKIGDERAVPFLVEVIKNRDSKLMKTALDAIRNFDDEKAADVLLGCLSDLRINDEAILSSVLSALAVNSKSRKKICEQLHTMLLDSKDKKRRLQLSEILLKFEDPRGIPEIVERLFEIPRRQSQTEFYAHMLKNVTRNSNLTEEIYNLIIPAASYGIISCDTKHDNEKPSQAEGDKAVRALCGIKSCAASNILYLITGKKDIDIELPMCAYSEKYSLDFSGQREIASAELAARGFAGYDPEAYYIKQGIE